MHLEIITPDKKVFSGEVVMVQFPGQAGSFQILENHAPIISTLTHGKVVLRTPDSREQAITVDGGVVEVLNNKISVLVESAVTA